eukprot:CAMPEP_0173187368 /NCGR_PEP_ID=MMETSP1141-20130122/10664_1 /TAXON_ID=483371 /ORGANISM="non described non described, Strain CCMP2298" /LENGTH=57 /DNA_ID=CAMNT_0014111185 /DNA_START=651 /DNA_END=820 /DNA_ORIENTATION=-
MNSGTAGTEETRWWAGIAHPSPFDAGRLDLASWTTAASRGKETSPKPFKKRQLREDG